MTKEKTSNTRLNRLKESKRDKVALDFSGILGGNVFDDEAEIITADPNDPASSLLRNFGKVQLGRGHMVRELQELSTDEELLNFVHKYFHIRVPTVAVTEGNAAPAEAFCDAFFERFPISLWWASRASSKSFLAGLLAVLNTLRYARCETTILAGSEQQGRQVYGAAETHVYEAKLDKYINLKKTFATSDNGSIMRVLTASPKSARGPHPQKLFLDECLVPSTLVSTPSGCVELQHVCVGDVVYGWNGQHITTGVVSRKKNMGVRPVFRVLLQNGREIIGTGNHKILTEEGWKRIDELTTSDIFFQRRTELFRMREEVQSQTNTNDNGLLPNVLSEKACRNAPSLSKLWDIRDRQVEDLSSLLQQGASQTTSKMSGLRKSSKAARYTTVQRVLAYPSVPDGNDTANGGGSCQSPQEEWSFKRRTAMCGTSGILSNTVQRTSTHGALRYRLCIASTRSSRRSTWDLLARQTLSQEKRRTEKSFSGRRRFYRSFSENRRNAYVVEEVAGRVGIAEITYYGEEEVWDITVPGLHSFIAEGVVVHNCDEIPRDVFNAAINQPMTKHGVQKQTLMTSTMHKVAGLMGELVENAAQNGIRVYKWNYKEVTQQCDEPDCRELVHSEVFRGMPCPLLGKHHELLTDLSEEDRAYIVPAREYITENGLDPETGMFLTGYYDGSCQGGLRHSEGFVPVDDQRVARMQVPKRVWEVENECRRPSQEDMVYDPLLLERGTISIIPWDEYLDPERNWAMVDWGFNNPTAMIIAQERVLPSKPLKTHPYHRCLIKEWYWEQRGLNWRIDQIVRIVKHYNIQQVYADGENIDALHALREALAVANWPCLVRGVPFNRFKDKLIDDVRNDMENGHWFISEQGCPNLLRDLYRLHYRPNTEDVAKEDDHGPDAMIAGWRRFIDLGEFIATGKNVGIMGRTQGLFRPDADGQFARPGMNGGLLRSPGNMNIRPGSPVGAAPTGRRFKRG